MARRVTFDVVDEQAPQARATTPRTGMSRAPALSGMARSLQDAASASIQEISTDLIDDSEFQDRFDIANDPDLEDLAQSIATSGQLIPILVSPDGTGRYKIVYGRRRLAALRKIGKPAKALVRSLGEGEAILAQGQENSIRKDPSWIEKAVFAGRLLAAGTDEGLICDALNIDQKARRAGGRLTSLYRMDLVTRRIPEAIISAIGPAPAVGRDRWYGVARVLRRAQVPAGTQSDAIIETLDQARRDGKDSDQRFAIFEQMLLEGRLPSATDAFPSASAETEGRQVIDEDPAQEPQRQKSRLHADREPPGGARQIKLNEGAVRITSRAAVITVRNGDPHGLHAWIAGNPEQALKALVEAREKSLASDNGA